MSAKKSIPQKIHFIGMGGIGMSGLARLYLSLGHPVQGSDAQRSDSLADLERLGADVFIGHDASHVSSADRVVYSSSIPADHPERLAAARRGLSVIHRSEALAELCRDKSTIAVTGTHGKTTTTAMIGVILVEAGRDPSVAVGGVVREFGGNARLGSGPEIVIEADESDSSFLNFLPDFAVVTNIDREHMENFGTMEAVEAAYEKFIRRLPEDGLWVGCAEDERVLRLADRRIRPCRLYGFKPHPNRFWADEIEECPGGEKGAAFTVWSGDRRLGRVRLNLIGRHNVLNALAALAVAEHLGADFAASARALSRFEGAGRRFEVRLQNRDFWVVDDYAHHPMEIRKTLAAARRLGRRIVALFQPHRFSRTEDLFRDFQTAFQDADKVFITDVYAASEPPREGVTGQSLARGVREAGHGAAAYVSRQELTDAALAAALPGDLLLTLGAGDITLVSYDLAKRLSKAGSAPAVPPFADLRGVVRTGEPLSKHTTLRIGGPADFWAEPEDEEDLRALLAEARRRAMKVAVFGAGSNVLAADEGFRGVVVSLGAPFFRRVREENGVLIAGAGTPNTLFIAAALERGFGGFEFLSGVPGQVGGAVAMNAGSHGQSVDLFLETARVIDFSGRERVLDRSEMGFRYRSSSVRAAVIVEARFRFPRAPAKDVRARLDEYREYRAATQDLRHASAGCLFKNPGIPGRSSGKLIDDAGLKGFRVGNAQISEKHANFLINLGGATAEDVRKIIEEARGRVKEKFGIELETEVEIL